jgi:hypothetical protein
MEVGGGASSAVGVTAEVPVAGVEIAVTGIEVAVPPQAVKRRTSKIG